MTHKAINHYKKFRDEVACKQAGIENPNSDNQDFEETFEEEFTDD